MSKFSLAFLVLMVVSCNIQNKRQPHEVCLKKQTSQREVEVSITDQKKLFSLHGQFVGIKGVFRFDFEDVALYPSGGRSGSDIAIWLNLKLLSDQSEKSIEELNGKTVFIIGKVDTLKKGHLSSYLSELDSVICIRGY